jgi:hypothetical protein
MKPTRTKPHSGRVNINIRSFSLVEPLRLDDSLFTPSAVEETLVKEGLLRGARDVELIQRLTRRRARASAPPPSAAPGRSAGLYLDRLSEPDRVSPADLVWEMSRAFREMAQQEFAALPGNVQTAFRAMTNEKNRTLSKDKKIEPFDYYLDLRAAYYQAGYDNPVEDIFKKIVPAKLLGHDIAFGVHQEFVRQLSGLEGLLNSWSPGLAERTGKEIKRMDGGFVPRYIAPKQGQASKVPVLSNHAFGLAVDIDPDHNPHIKDRDVIDALKEATGYDWGSPFVEYSMEIPNLDRIAQTHTQAQNASERLQRWLQKYLTIYKEGYSQFPDPETERNIRLLDRIRKFHSLSDLETWARSGIQSVPLYLAVAMTKLTFRWGSAYDHSKDAMHFELLAPSTIPPNAKVRPVDDLLGLIGP